MKKRPRVVVDSNVIISGIITTNSYSSKIINAWMTGKCFTPIISDELIAEVKDVLQRSKIKSKLTLENPNIKIILGTLINRAEKVKAKPIATGLFSDSKDHFLLELAVTAKAKIIVTGDMGIIHHLKYGDIDFQTPENFCNELTIK